jgi:predicted nuclease of predicted toxin-antitoxin system
VRFLVDAHLPPRLSVWINTQGFYAVHVKDALSLEATDSQIWSFLLQSGAVLITKDDDFAIRCQYATDACPQVVWLRVGNCSNASLISWITPIWPDILRQLRGGDSLIEVV